MIQDRVDTTQFVLTSLATANPRARVEVPNPLESASIPLKAVYDKFTPNKDGFEKSFFGWLEGEQPQGKRPLDLVRTQKHCLCSLVWNLKAYAGTNYACTSVHLMAYRCLALK